MRAEWVSTRAAPTGTVTERCNNGTIQIEPHPPQIPRHHLPAAGSQREESPPHWGVCTPHFRVPATPARGDSCTLGPMQGYLHAKDSSVAQARRCTSCGAIAEFPPGAVSATCSYCGSPLVDAERARFAVEKVAPFRLTRVTAQEKLKSHLRGHFWAPSKIRKGILEDHRVRGVLVPFYAYRGVARSQYHAQVGIYYYKTETYRDSQGKTRTRRKRVTEWFSHSGSAIGRLHGHLVSASAGLPEPESYALEPFDLGRTQPFNPALISGWEAELPSLERPHADHTARQEVTALEANRITHHLLPGDVGSVSNISTDITLEKCEVILLPVWMATFRHGGKIYRQLVNGQSGKTTGEVPTSTVKVGLAIGALLLTIAAIVLGVQAL